MTATDLDLVRDWVGSQPDDTTVTATLARFDGDTQAPTRAALVILRRRLADLEAAPSSMSIAGDVSWSTTVDQAQGIRAKIARLEVILGETSTSSTTPTLGAATIVGPGNPR